MSLKKIVVMRYNSDEESTQGLLMYNSKFFCYTLEDQFQAKKIKGETRIPEGTYNLGLQMAATPLTLSYRKKYDWFKNHIHIKNVPGFTGIYIHVGNDDGDTAGCLLLGDTSINDPKDISGFQGRSRQAFERFYKKFYEDIVSGSVVIEFLNISV